MHVQVYVVASMCLCVRVWLCVLWFYVHVCASTAQCVNPCNYVQRFAHRATFEEPHKGTHSGIFDGMVHETARKQAQYVVESPSTFSRYSRGNATQTQNPRVPPLAEVFVLRFAAIVVNLRTAFASVGNDGRAHKCRTACQAGRFPAIRIKNLQNPSSHISASFSCEFVAVAKKISSTAIVIKTSPCAKERGHLQNAFMCTFPRHGHRKLPCMCIDFGARFSQCDQNARTIRRFLLI